MASPQNEALFDGMRVADIARQQGLEPKVARARLSYLGYSVEGGIARKRASAQDVEDEIHDRLQRTAPSGPCFRCGARAGCAHRPDTTITNGERP